MAVDTDEIIDAINQALLEEITKEGMDTRKVLRMAEARAWIVHPAQDHGSGESAE